jgi:hypothetical protein
MLNDENSATVRERLYILEIQATEKLQEESSRVGLEQNRIIGAIGDSC